MDQTGALFLVEGQDDKHIVQRLLDHHGVTDFRIEDKEGCDRLLKELPVVLKGSALGSIGIVLDADVDLAKRWRQVCSIFEKAGYQSVPATPTPGGTLISEGDKPNIGVWLMPDNSAAGELEDFVAQLIPEDDACWPIAVEVVASLQPPVRPFSEGDIPKARIHTWLAWRENPGVKMGAAITRKYLDPDQDSANAFVSWARRIISGAADPA